MIDNFSSLTCGISPNYLMSIKNIDGIKNLFHYFVTYRSMD